MFPYYFAIVDTATGTVWVDLLRSQIVAAIAAPFRDLEVRYDAGVIGVWFTVALTPVQEAALDAVIVAHNGTGPQNFAGFTTTLTAAPTTVVTVPMRDNVVFDIDLRVAARRTDVGKALGKRLGVTVRRGTGPASIVITGSTVLYAHLEAPIAWTADPVANVTTGNLDLVVVGAAASPVDWWGYANVIEV